MVKIMFNFPTLILTKKKQILFWKNQLAYGDVEMTHWSFDLLMGNFVNKWILKIKKQKKGQVSIFD